MGVGVAGDGAGTEGAAGELEPEGSADEGLPLTVAVDVFAEGAEALGAGDFGEFGVVEAVEAGLGGMTKTKSTGTALRWRDVEG